MRTAVDYGERGIRLNCTSPGTTKTPMGDQFDQMPGNEFSDVFTGGIPNSNEEQVNLEHVLPRNAIPGDWTAFSDEERRPFADRLGNVALLAKSQNGQIGNRPFRAKRAILSASDLRLTHEIGSENAWGPQEIERRQARLAKLAVQVWKRKP
jgi:NAD(P)-dependent dehydrogenase (short-subunit alcohol dehydrogenase family)